MSNQRSYKKRVMRAMSEKCKDDDYNSVLRNMKFRAVITPKDKR